MTGLDQIELHTKHLKMDAIPKETLYIGVAGFEDRCLGFLKNAAAQGKKFQSCVAIEYQPFDTRNRKTEFTDSAAKVFDGIQWKTYDRFSPEDFTQSLHEIIDLSRSISRVIVDVSAMSKMLVVVLLHGLRDLNLPLSIIYAPAEVYHPLKGDYEKAKGKLSDASPYFLTTDVYKVVTTTALSSIAMQGAPLVVIAFPNFNHLEIAALLNETNAQKLFLIESVAPLEQNAWRLDAIRWINRGLETYVTPSCYRTDASDLNANIEILESIYDDWHLSHKIALSPTGGKLQAVATFCLKNMHPDIHIVYPVVRKFAKDYTEGYLAHSEISFQNFRDYVTKLDHYRMRRLSEIKQIIERPARNAIGKTS
jgi:hypothetical protein